MIGVVSSVAGSVVIRGADGQSRRLQVGDEVKAGDVITTSSSSSVQIECSDDVPFIVPADTEFLATEECFSFSGDASENEV